VPRELWPVACNSISVYESSDGKKMQISCCGCLKMGQSCSIKKQNRVAMMGEGFRSWPLARNSRSVWDIGELYAN
jgi:hypothetical protein